MDQIIKVKDYVNCHQKYPLGALGHRVHKIPFHQFPSLFKAFGIQTYISFLENGLFKDVLGPYHQGEKWGLWAIEPHLGGKGFGAKFEEILIVDKNEIRWLDNEVPHIKELL